MLQLQNHPKRTYQTLYRSVVMLIVLLLMGWPVFANSWTVALARPAATGRQEAQQALSTAERGVYVVGTIAYVADSERGLRIFDVTDPHNPRQLSQVPIGAQEVHVVNNHAYAAAAGGGMVIIDVSNPSQPIQKSVYAATAWDVYAEGNLVYVAAWRDHVQVVDVSNSTNPIRITDLPVSDRAVGVEVSGNLAFVVDNRDKGVRIYDVTDPPTRRQIGFAVIGGTHEKVHVTGNRAYLASATGGIHIIDITTPSNPVRLGGYDTPGYAREVYVVDNLAYVADQEGGVRVLDVANPANPREINAYQTPGNAQGIFVSNDVIYVADSVVGLHVIPLSPYGPEPLPDDSINVGPPGDPSELCCIGGYVYLNGRPASNPRVTLRTATGFTQLATIHTTGVYSYFSLDLTSSDLALKVGDSVDLTAEVNGATHTRSYTIQAGTQQVDLVMPNDSGYTRPIATINQRSHIGVIDVDETLVLQGSGQDSDSSPGIGAYEWRSDRLTAPLGNSATLQINASQLGLGRHQITLRVQDEEGQWSQPVAYPIKVIEGWTLLLYLAGDYPDTIHKNFGQVIQEFIQEQPNLPPNVNVAVLSDGPSLGDTKWLTFSATIPSPQVNMQANAALTKEVAMNDPQTLSAFVKWGQSQFPNTHYYLAIADHGQGVTGIAWDRTLPSTAANSANRPAYMRTNEIDDALADPQIQKLDILHLDACSMNLLESAYELRKVANFLISSQFLTWNAFAYPRYAANVSVDTAPATFATQVAQDYAQSVQSWGGDLPYTIAVLELQHTTTVERALSDFTREVQNQIGKGPITLNQLEQIRLASQVFESENKAKNYAHEATKDFYIDLADWTDRVLKTTTHSAIQGKGTKLLGLLNDRTKFVHFTQANSGPMPGKYKGATINLDQAHGVSIFYPVEEPPGVNQPYFNHNLFAFTQTSTWPDLLGAVGILPDPVGTDEPLPDPVAPLESPTEQSLRLFLPLVQR